MRIAREMNCHCCHWVEVEAQVEVEAAVPVEVQPSTNDALALAPSVATEHTVSPFTLPAPMCLMYVDNEIRAFLRDLKELTEEGLLAETEASTLRLDFIRIRMSRIA